MSRVSLIYPPVAQPFAASLSVAELASVFTHSEHSVKTYDLNIRAYQDLFNSSYLKSLEEFFLTKAEKFEEQNELFEEDIIEFHNSIEALKRLPVLINKIDDTVSAFRNINNYSLDNKGLEVLRKEWILFEETQKVIFGIRDKSIYEDASCFLNYNSIIAALNNPEITPFDEIFDDYIEEILIERPDIIGISITFPEQFIPAFILSSKIRKKSNCKIVLGGSIPKFLKKELITFPDLIQKVDAICIGDGEPTLLDFANGIELKNIPNIIYTDSNNQVRQTKFLSWDIRNSYPPVFNKEDLKRLFTPKPVIPYQTVRCCYYGNCKFCNYTIINSNIKERNINQIVEDIIFLSKEYDSNLISIADDATSAKRLNEISIELIKKDKTDLLWWTCTRFDGNWNPKLIDNIEKAGCARLFYGLESANNRVQELLAGKGFNIEKVNTVLEYLSSTKIHPHLSAIIGFPTETYSEALETVNFLIEKSKKARVTSRIHKFRLVKDSPFAKSIQNHENMGILEIKDSELNNLSVELPKYLTTTNLSNDELIDLFTKYQDSKERLQHHYYGEYHTYEPLYWASKYNREIPKLHLKPLKNKSSLAGPIINPFVTIRKVNFSPMKAKDITKRIFERAEELVFNKTGKTWNQSLRLAISDSETINRSESLLVYNVLKHNSKLFNSSLLPLFAIFDGIRNLEEIENWWIKKQYGNEKNLNDLLEFLLISEIIII